MQTGHGYNAGPTSCEANDPHLPSPYFHAVAGKVRRYRSEVMVPINDPASGPRHDHATIPHHGGGLNVAVSLGRALSHRNKTHAEVKLQETLPRLNARSIVVVYGS